MTYSLRTVLVLVKTRNLELIQLDIKPVFLYGELKEELYLEMQRRNANCVEKAIGYWLEFFE
jgi:hypothetical protein